jgi:type II secretory pathway component PulF
VSDAAFFRSLAELHRAGIAWPEAVRTAGGGDARWDAAVQALGRGAPLSDALGEAVDPLDRALLRAGEQDGSLERVLRDVSEHHEAARRRRGRRTASLAYPLLVAHVAALLLPLPDLLQGRPGAALLWGLAALVPTWTFLLLLRRADRRERPRPGETGPPPAPAQGPLSRNRVEAADARGLEAFGRLLSAGVPLGSALDHAVRAGWGGRAAVDLAGARERLPAGGALAAGWRSLPPGVARRLAAAETAGALGEEARRVAEELDLAVDLRRQRAAAVLPVVATLVLGALVALRVLSFYGALYGNLAR